MANLDSISDAKFRETLTKFPKLLVLGSVTLFLATDFFVAPTQHKHTHNIRNRINRGQGMQISNAVPPM